MSVRVKFCGLSRFPDIEAVNELMPDYAGFVFWDKSKRYVTPENAEALRRGLSPRIKAVGVFVDENPEIIAEICGHGIIGIIQLHGHENEEYISRLRTLTNKPVIKAFKVREAEDVMRAENCTADFVMLDSGMGTGKVFDWSLLAGITRPYFLAGGLDAGNVREAVSRLRPYAVDVSSGIETGGVKDRMKMSEFIAALREE
ncbi:MAG: phosphoribosylanthranilate isomerase [Synergistaceae bacterium]|nr:phosphoribosylanthranilate isomerase [Synergistaceae bacterium]MBQ6419383.1 phosphoribosylanthranilate isomerase [Synergistaceae bacterium]